MSYKLAGVIWNDDGTMATKKLTLQELELLNTASAYNGAQHNAICGRAALELIEYKKIEEELGIDLLTLFKAFKNGIWIKFNTGSRTYNYKTGEDKETGDQIVFHKAPYETLPKNIAYFRRLFEKEFVDNYGKTWALTKEELL